MLSPCSGRVVAYRIFVVHDEHPSIFQIFAGFFQLPHLPSPHEQTALPVEFRKALFFTFRVEQFDKPKWIWQEAGNLIL